MANTKTLLSLLLLPALVILIIRAAAVRQRGMVWLEDLNERITPLALEEFVGAPEEKMPRPVASASCEDKGARETVPAVAASAEKEAQRVNDISHARIELERALDSLPETGHMGRSYFKRLAGEMEDCRLKLRSPDPKLRHGGELLCHRLAMQMVEDRGSCGGVAAEAMDRYMPAFADGIQEICLRRRLPPSRERSAFTRWAAGHMEDGEKNVLLFLIRLLGIMGDGSSVEAVGRNRQSADPDIRSAAIWAMGMHGSPDVIDDIEEALSDRSLPASEGEAFLVALGRIGGARASAALCEAMRDARPLLAYDAYLSLKELRGQAGRPLSIDEFVRGRTTVVDEYAAWLKRRNE